MYTSVAAIFAEPNFAVNVFAFEETVLVNCAPDVPELQLVAEVTAAVDPDTPFRLLTTHVATAVSLESPNKLIVNFFALQASRISEITTSPTLKEPPAEVLAK